MTTNGVSGTGSSTGSTVVDPTKTGFNGLNSQDFMKLLITQLQNQDPTEPTDSGQLLDQLSSMRSLQSNIELGETLKNITLGQQVSTGTSFLGKVVIGKTTDNVDVVGVVDSVYVREGQTYVGSGDDEIPVKNITGVALANANPPDTTNGT